MMMWRGPAVVVVGWWLAVAAGLVACSKPGSAPPAVEPRPVAIDVSRLEAPRLLEHIPADAPFALVSFDAIPLEYYAKARRVLGPGAARIRAAIREHSQDHELMGKLEAFAGELDGKWSAEGLASLGLATTPRFAIYALAERIIVVRLEVADARALLATVQRIARRAGAALPPAEGRQGRELWRAPISDDTEAVVSFGGTELVAAFGPREAISSALPLILGEAKPGHRMGDGRAFKELIVRHQLGPVMIGFASTRWLADRLIAPADPRSAPACTTELRRLAARAPRLVFGFNEITARRVTGGVALELDRGLADTLKALKSEAPGLGAALAEETLFAAGGAIDLSLARGAFEDLASAIGRLGGACDHTSLKLTADLVSDALASQVPEPIASITGVALAIDDTGDLFEALDAETLPRRLEAFAMVTARDTKALTVFLGDVLGLRRLGFDADGKLHKLATGGPLEVHAGANERALVAGAGTYGKRRGEQALRAPGGGPAAPLLLLAVDYTRIFAARPKLQQTLPDPHEIGAQLGKELTRFVVDGRWRITADPSDAGLAIRISGKRE